MCTVSSYTVSSKQYQHSAVCAVYCIVRQPLEEIVCSTRALFLSLSVYWPPEETVPPPQLKKQYIPPLCIVRCFLHCPSTPIHKPISILHRLESQRMALFYLPQQHHHHFKEKVLEVVNISMQFATDQTTCNNHQLNSTFPRVNI